MDISYIKHVLPLRVWRASKGVGSFLTFDMGEKHTVSVAGETRESGDLHLWIYLCEWAIKQGASVLLSDDVIDDATAGRLNVFFGKSLISVEIDDADRLVVFEFEGSLKLILASGSETEPDDELFIAYLKDGVTFSYSTGEGLVLEQSNGAAC